MYKNSRQLYDKYKKKYLENSFQIHKGGNNDTFTDEKIKNLIEYFRNKKSFS